MPLVLFYNFYAFAEFVCVCVCVCVCVYVCVCMCMFSVSRMFVAKCIYLVAYTCNPSYLGS
jgi:hypothetical protein